MEQTPAIADFERVLPTRRDRTKTRSVEEQRAEITRATSARVWSPPEIAQAGLLTVQQVYRSIRAGRIDAIRVGKNRFAICQEDLQRFLKSRGA